MKKTFTWIEQVEKIFELLKKKVSTQLALVLPSFDKLFTIEYDASNIVVRKVLSQDNIPVAYFSEKLNESKKRYSYYYF